MENCVICQQKTIGLDVHGVIICECCEGKYGNKLKGKLLELDLIKPEKPFECSLYIKGGNKQDRINMILSTMDEEDISIEDLENNK